MSQSTSLESATNVRLFDPSTANRSLLLSGKASRRIRVAAAGNLTVVLIDDTASVTLTGLVIGEILDVQAVATKKAGTTVTAIEVFY